MMKRTTTVLLTVLFAGLLAMPAALGGIVAFHAGQGAPWAT